VVLLAIAVTANALASISSLPTVVGAVFGVVALGLGALLLRDHLRRRASSRRSPDQL
jgi:hypothetical protein